MLVEVSFLLLPSKKMLLVGCIDAKRMEVIEPEEWVYESLLLEVKFVLPKKMFVVDLSLS